MCCCYKRWVITIDKRKHNSYGNCEVTCLIHSGTMELLKMMMLVGVFVHITGALSVEGVQKHMLYYISEKAVKEYILVYLPVIELVFVCMIYSFSYFHLASSSTYLYFSSLQHRQAQNKHSCVFIPFLQYINR